MVSDFDWTIGVFSSAADCTAEGHSALESDSAANRCAILKGGFIKGQWTKEVD
jgi:hypothetical protein